MATALRRALIWDGGKKSSKFVKSYKHLTRLGSWALFKIVIFSITPNNEYVAPTEMLL